MNKITFKYDKKEINIIINDYKLIIGKDYESKDKILRLFVNYMNKNSLSEFAKENNLIYSILWNDEYLKQSDFELFYVSQQFDVLNDLKLGSKSLGVRTMEVLLQETESSEEFQTLQLILNDYFDLLDDKFNDEFLNLSILPKVEAEINRKNLLKMLCLNCFKDEYGINNYDLSLKERIFYQLNLINIICKYSNKKNIIILKCDYFDLEILEIIEKIKAYKIVITNKLECETGFEKVYIMDNISIDLLEEEELYNLCMNSSKNYSLTDMRRILMEEYLK